MEPGKIEVSYRPIGTLIPHARNARTHTSAQVEQIAASIQEFGWTNPVLADGANGVLAGHGRLLAAAKLGMDEVPVIELAGLTETQKRAYVIADNKTALNAGWDYNILKLELVELGEVFDLALTGFSGDEVSGIVGAAEGLTDPDEVPEPPAEPITQPGDLIELGEHRLMCGDATSADDVLLLLVDMAPHLMVTDPPYGVEYDADWRNKALRANGSTIGGRAVGPVQNDDKADWREAWALFPGDVAYVWHGHKGTATVQEGLEVSGFEMRGEVIWVKNTLVVGRGDYHWQHEAAWYAVRKGKTGHWNGDRKQSTVWQIDKPMKSETGHSTQKPVECMRRPIQNNSKPGDHVYDPFLGSGTTIIAAETTGRVCLGLEIDTLYCDIIVARWEAFTGKAAKRPGRLKKKAG